ncbi:hypothetical protein ACFYT4_02610 [Streptomyces sp. NPDC004609]|uniref:hypothetical protein n=1 Tax=Streptomyces sp. NPDC004609 TaxID=3364704 RepID=UPI0036B7B730
MRKNLAGLAHEALMARSAPDTGPAPSVPTRFDSGTEAAVADLCIRDGLGFILLLHRRDDGLVGEEIYCSTREGDGSWAAADHLSGGLVGIELTDARQVAGVLRGEAMAVFSESETLLFTGRDQADEDGCESVRIYEFLVDPQVELLDIEDTSPGADTATAGAWRSPVSQAAVVALFPGERVRVRAMTGNGTGLRPLGESQELTGPGDELPFRLDSWRSAAG